MIYFRTSSFNPSPAPLTSSNISEAKFKTFTLLLKGEEYKEPLQKAGVKYAAPGSEGVCRMRNRNTCILINILNYFSHPCCPHFVAARWAFWAFPHSGQHTICHSFGSCNLFTDQKYIFPVCLATPGVLAKGPKHSSSLGLVVQ